MNVPDVFKDAVPKLVESLPMKDPHFIARLTKAELFSGDLAAKVSVQATKAIGATVFLNEAIEPFLDLEKDVNPLFKLLSVMNDFDNPQLKQIAAEIRNKLSAENPRRRTTTEDIDIDTTDNETVRNLPPSLVERCSSGYSSLASQSVGESCTAEGMLKRLVQGAVLIEEIQDKNAKPLMSELNRFVSYKHGIASKWKDISVELGLEFDALEDIERKNIHKNIDCFKKALNMWLNTIPCPTWSALEVAITNVNRAELGLHPVNIVFDAEDICVYKKNVIMDNSEVDSIPQCDTSVGTSYELSSGDFLIIDNLADHLREKYINKRHTRYHNEKKHWPPNVLQMIVSIAMITYGNKEPIKQYILIVEHHRKGAFSMDQLITKNYDTSPSKRRRSYDFRIIKNIAEIFASDPQKQVNLNRQPKSILIEGIPGVGKTTLAKEIAYCWASKEILNDVTILFLLFLRDPALQQINDLVELVEYVGGGCLDYEQRKSCTNLLNNGKNICFILDGYDEYHCSSQESFITKLIERDILPGSILVITSRHTANAFDLRDKVEKRIEILGLDKKERDKYVTEALSESRKIEFDKYLKEHPIINNYCYVPLYLVILLHLFQYDYLPESLTELNKLFVFHTVVRHLKGLGKTPIKKFEDLLQLYPDFMEKLCCLAFTGLKDDRLVFSIDEIHFEVNDEFFKNGFGLLQPLQYYSEEGTSFNFCHFTLQEFLAAYYVSMLSIEQQSVHMKNSFWTDRFAYMWVMYVGIMGVKNNLFVQFISGGKTYKNENELKISDTIQKDKIKKLHLFQCYMEANSKGEMPKLISSLFMNGEIKFDKASLHPHHVSSLMFFMSMQSALIPWKKLELENTSLDDNSMNTLEQFMNDNKDKIITLEHINLSGNSVSPWGVYCAAIENCQVETLSLSATSMKNHMEKIRQSLQNTDRLRVLKLFNVKCSDLALLENILQYGITLNSLDLSWERNPKHVLLKTKRSNVTVSICCDILPSDAWSIDLSSKKLGNHEAQFLAFGLLNNTSLVKFNVSQNRISDDGAKAICASLKENTKLNELDISKNNITDSGVMSLMGDIQTLSSLQKLNISGLSISDKVATFISKQIKENTHLSSFDISDARTTMEGAKTLVETLQTNRTITVLYIQNINLSDNGMAALGAYIKNNVLKELYISQNKITDEGLEFIANAIKTNISLCNFDISNNLLSGKGLVYLLEKIADSKESMLNYLCVSHNNVTKSTWSNVTECIKNISSPMKIITSWNEIVLKSGVPMIKTTVWEFCELDHVNPREDIQEHFVKKIRSTEHRIRIITSCLIENKILSSIHLSGINITASGAKFFAKVILCNTKLSTLNIAQNELSDQGIVVLSENLKENKVLCTLNLSDNYIRCKGAIKLAEALKDNKALKVLNISNNCICDKGAVAILSSNNLKTLNLSDNDITEKGVAIIADVIGRNTSLQHLYLFQRLLKNKPTFHKTILNSIKQFNYTIIKLALPWLDETLDSSKYDEVKLLLGEINEERAQSKGKPLKCLF